MFYAGSLVVGGNMIALADRDGGSTNGLVGLFNILPAVGPLVVAVWTFFDASPRGGGDVNGLAVAYGVNMLLMAAAQTVGAYLLIYGYVQDARSEEEQESGERHVSVSFVPGGPGNVGASIVGWF